MNETEIENPGAPFRETREKLGLSIQDVAIATKINARILRALEDGDKRNLPPTSFARGFIRSYAAYLKIDSKPILLAFNLNLHNSTPHIQTEIEEQKARSDGTETVEIEVGKPPDRRSNSERRLYSGVSRVNSKFYVVAGLMALVLLAFGFKRIFDKYAQERNVPAVSIDPLQALPETKATEESTNDLSNEQNSETTANSDEKVRTLPSVIQGLPQNTTEVKNDPVPAPSTKEPEVPPNQTVATPAQSENKEAAAPVVVAPKPIEEAKKVVSPGAKSQEIIIEALDKVDISIAVDGGDFKKITLGPESIHTVKATTSVRLEIKDGGMVNIIHNGRDKGVPGDLGRPISVKYP